MLYPVVAVLCAVVASAALPECTPADVRFAFTPCNASSGMMTSVSYYSRACQESAAVTLQPPRVAPCILSCGSGTWYSPETIDCQQCPAGQMSNSGGHVINDFRTFPIGMTTYCSPQPCSVWAAGPGGTYMMSGNQSIGQRASEWSENDESVESVLVTLVPVINPRGGMVRFLYRVESEYHFDGLELYVNGTLHHDGDADRHFLLSGFHKNWYEITVPLPVGMNEVKWVYKKDINQESAFGKAVGTDMAYIRDIVIEGVQLFAPSCVPCAAGKHAPAPGSMHCSLCPANTWSGVGSAQCGQCAAETEWAPPGSAACRHKADCTKSDYVAVYSKCDKVRKTRTRDWQLASSRCRIVQERGYPQDQGLPCASCMPGFRRDSTTYECQRCPDGQYFQNLTSTCQPCEAGTFATRTIDFSSGFEEFGRSIDPQFFTFKCEGECQACPPSTPHCTTWNSGFVLSSTTAPDVDNTAVVIRSDMDNGAQYKSTLFYNWTSLAGGRIFFRYRFDRMSTTENQAVDSDGYSATLTVDGESLDLDTTFQTNGNSGSQWFYYSKGGNHQMTIEFELLSTHSASDPVGFVLESLLVEGDTRGSTAACSACAPGNYCPFEAQQMMPCPAGTYRSLWGGVDQGSCLPCPDGQVAEAPGQQYCRRCSRGTSTNTAKTLCVNTCNYTSVIPYTDEHQMVRFKEVHYDLTALRGRVYGPIFPEGFPSTPNTTVADENNVHRFFLSPCGFVNSGVNDHICKFNAGNEVQDAYVCQRVTVNQSYAAGDHVDYALHEGNVQMSFTGGDLCQHGDMERSTNLTIICDPTAPVEGRLEYFGENPHCHYTFALTTPLGCPLCTADSYQRSVGECRNDSKQEVIYYKVDPNDNCHGGWTPPPNHNASCDFCQPDYYEDMWGDCVAGKQQKMRVLKPEHRDCGGAQVVYAEDEGGVAQERECHTINTTLGSNVFTYTVVGVLVGILLLLSGIVVIHCRYKALQNRYARLSSRADAGGDGELHEVPSALDDEKEEKHNDPMPIADD